MRYIWLQTVGSSSGNAKGIGPPPWTSGVHSLEWGITSHTERNTLTKNWKGKRADRFGKITLLGKMEDRFWGGKISWEAISRLPIRGCWRPELGEAVRRKSGAKRIGFQIVKRLHKPLSLLSWAAVCVLWTERDKAGERGFYTCWVRVEDTY